MFRGLPRSTRTYTRLPYTTLFRSQRAARHPSDDRAGDRRGALDLLAEEFDALRFDAFALTPVDRPQGSRYRAFERLFEPSGAGAYRQIGRASCRERVCQYV